MKFSLPLVILALAAETATASSWFSKAVYNKWHETELERWLSDHNIPYPTPADRKDLENLVKSNWNEKVVYPYNEWEPSQLQVYLKSKGQETSEAASANKDALVKQVKTTWTESTDSASNAYSSVRDWIFDSWTDSQLKAFCDKNGIPVPQPRKRDTLLAAVRSNYETAAGKVNEYVHYPGDWLYESWTQSDLKAYLDERGIPAPQPTTRDKLIATVRRNSRQASLNMKAASAAASSSAEAAQKSLSDQLIEAWSDSQIKEWADKHGIKVPQGSKRNELIAIARKNRQLLLNEASSVSSSAASAFGAATSKAGNEYAQATDDASLMADDAFDKTVSLWSDSRLKAYLDARGIPVPQAGKRDELLAKVRLNKHKAETGFSAWTFDTWTTENLKQWLGAQNHKAAKKSGASRDELVKYAQDTYASASKSGGSTYASVTSYLASATGAAKDSTFDTWSDSELKSYLDSYGVSTYQGSTTNELRAMARRNANYFRYGTTTPQGTIWAKVQENVQWIMDQLKIGQTTTKKEAAYQAEKAGDRVKEGYTDATDRAGEAAQQAGDRIKEEL